MAYSFPGMNPYLENPELWPEVHHLLIGLLAESLNPQLLPKYRMAIEKRVYQLSDGDSLLVGIPDATVEQSGTTIIDSTPPIPANVAVMTPKTKPVSVTVPMTLEIREGYLEVRDRETRHVVTVIEILSPTNKRGKGRETYEEKRQNILNSRTHLVEIDLLRSGNPMPYSGSNIQGNYRILVSRSNRRPRADLYVFDVYDRIPIFSLPLQAGDVEPEIDLHQLLSQAYDRAGYDFAIDYNQEPIPPLSETERDGVDEMLREKKLRQSL